MHTFPRSDDERLRSAAARLPLVASNAVAARRRSVLERHSAVRVSSARSLFSPLRFLRRRE
jgi:hypothetical protein